MRRVLFLSRVAFICNVFFVIAAAVQITRLFVPNDVASAMAFIGYFLVIVFNPLVNFIYLVLIFTRKLQLLPRWLVLANFLFLILQITYLFYLNDSPHT